MKFSQAPFWREGSHIYSLIFSQHFFELRKSSIFRRSFPHRSPFLFISLGGMHWGQTALKIRSSIFFVVVFFVVVTMVMNKLIQPELKPVSPPPPRRVIFMLYCCHCLQQERLNQNHYLLCEYQEGGDRVFLPV